MTAETNPRWRRKTTLALAAVLLTIVYPASFVPACWALMRTDPATHPVTWVTIRVVYLPVGAALAFGPTSLRRSAESAVNAGRPGLIGGIDLGPGRVTVNIVRHRLAEPGLTIRTHAYTVAQNLW